MFYGENHKFYGEFKVQCIPDFLFLFFCAHDFRAPNKVSITCNLLYIKTVTAATTKVIAAVNRKSWLAL